MWMSVALYALGAVLFLLITFKLFLGIVVIGEMQVGIVVKKVSKGSLPPGRLIALNGEAGIQADTLAPGWHFFKWSVVYAIQKVPSIEIAPGQIGLIVSKDGDQIPTSNILAKTVPCDNFQDARAFLTNGGQKGRQLAYLTAGVYRINTAAFSVVTSANAEQFDMRPEALSVFTIGAEKVGIVTTLDGKPIEQGEIAGPIVEGHDNFQNVVAFLGNGGCRGLQEQVLLAGSWNLNPWFVEVEEVSMTNIGIGYVGIVIAFVGKAHIDISGPEFRHGDLVEVGHKGVWKEPLLPGKHPINTRVMSVELVPTTQIVLNWANKTESHHYDERLSSIRVRSNDGFEFPMDVSQVIHIGANDAPKVISRVGSVQNLVDHVLEPMIGNYFRNSAQNSSMLDFILGRRERQEEAARQITSVLHDYDIEGVNTLIGDIVPPQDLMKTQTDRKIAQEQKKTFEVQELAQQQRQSLVKATSIAEIQDQLVKSEQGIMIAKQNAQGTIETSKGNAEQIRLKGQADADALRFSGLAQAEAQKARGLAEADIKRAQGLAEADALRAVGEAKASAYQQGVLALGPSNYTSIQIMDSISTHGVRITPNVLVSGQDSGSSGLANALLGVIVGNQNKEKEEQPTPAAALPNS